MKSLKFCIAGVLIALLSATVVSSSAVVRHVRADSCTMPPEPSGSFWMNMAGRTPGLVIEALGFEAIGGFVDTLFDSLNSPDAQREAEFKYISCELQAISAKLSEISRDLQNIQQAIVMTQVKALVTEISATYQTMIYVFQSCPNSTVSSVKSQIEHLFESITLQDMVYKAGVQLHSLLTESVSSGIDPVLLSISKNHLKEGILDYYVEVKKNAMFYWDLYSKAANLLKFAARFKDMEVFNKQAAELMTYVDAELKYLESGINGVSIIPPQISAMASDWLNSPDGVLTVNLKIWDAANGPAIFVREATSEIYQWPPCVTSGRGNVNTPGSTSITFSREKSSLLGSAPWGTGSVIWYYMGNPWVTERIFTNWGGASLMKLHFIGPNKPVDSSFEIRFLWEEYQGGGNWKWVCSLKGNTNCGDTLTGDRPSYDNVAGDKDCHFRITYNRPKTF
eukprot:ANDGO_02730.mRNA.1 hypothetical protein